MFGDDVTRALHILSPPPPSSLAPLQGSCTGLEFKASLEKFLNFIKLKMSLNCFGKRVEGLEKFGIAYVKFSTRLGDCENFLP